jgi:hypothetical protein
MLLSEAMWVNVPFFLAGTIKISYDLLLYRSFAATKAREERAAG